MQVAEFIRYAFKPLLGFVLVLGALGALTGMLWCCVTDEPLLAVLIFCSYIAIFSTIMLFSYLGFKKFRGTGLLVIIILIASTQTIRFTPTLLIC
jgi:hypothetical protein